MIDPSGPRGTPSGASIATVLLPTPASDAPAPPSPSAAIFVGSPGPARRAKCRVLLRPSAVVVVVPLVPSTQTCALRASCLNVIAGCAGTKQAAGSTKRRATTPTRDAVVLAILSIWSNSNSSSGSNSSSSLQLCLYTAQAAADTRYHAPLLFVDQMTPNKFRTKTYMRF